MRKENLKRRGNLQKNKARSFREEKGEYQDYCGYYWVWRKAVTTEQRPRITTTFIQGEKLIKVDEPLKG